MRHINYLDLIEYINVVLRNCCNWWETQKKKKKKKKIELNKKQY